MGQDAEQYTLCCHDIKSFQTQNPLVWPISVPVGKFSTSCQLNRALKSMWTSTQGKNPGNLLGLQLNLQLLIHEPNLKDLIYQSKCFKWKEPKLRNKIYWIQPTKPNEHDTLIYLPNYIYQTKFMEPRIQKQIFQTKSG